MSTFVSMADLPEPRKQLVALMQTINFGKIHHLHLAGGDPILLDPPPTVVRELKFGGDNAPRPERGRQNFLLKAQVRELLHELDRIGDGVVLLIEVRNGLPFRMQLPHDSQ